MPVIINPFQGQDPTAQAFANVGNAVFGNTGEAALRQQQIIDAQRKNVETMNLGQRIKFLGGAQNAEADPTMQAEAIESGYAPENVAKLGLMGAAMTAGAGAPATGNAQVAAGESYDNTAAATDAKLANAATIAGSDPVPIFNPATGQTGFSTKAAVALPGSGFAPVPTDSTEKGVQLADNWGNLPALNQQQQIALGVAKPPSTAGSVGSYLYPDGSLHAGVNTPSGIMDPTTGQLAPPGSHPVAVQGNQTDVGALDNSGKTTLQQTIQNNSDVVNGIAAVKTLAMAHPTSIGAVGAAREFGQDATQLAGAAASALGGQGAVAALRQQLSGLPQGSLKTLLPGLFDPSLPAVSTAYYALLYHMINAMTGQKGRAISNLDLEQAMHQIGSPDDFMRSMPSFVTSLDTVNAYSKYNIRSAQWSSAHPNEPYDDQGQLSKDLGAAGSEFTGVDNMQSGTATAPPVPLPGAAPPAAAPPAPAAMPVIRDDNDYNALPSGTKFTAPDGTIRTKP